MLATVAATGARLNPGPPDSTDRDLAIIFDQLRQNAAQYELLTQQNPYAYRLLRQPTPNAARMVTNAGPMRYSRSAAPTAGATLPTVSTDMPGAGTKLVHLPTRGVDRRRP
jgi:hypothetical protein